MLRSLYDDNPNLVTVLDILSQMKQEAKEKKMYFSNDAIVDAFHFLLETYGNPVYISEQGQLYWSILNKIENVEDLEQDFEN
ncbi:MULTISPECIES: hypothetical protein [Vagococcus]|uniref:Uncharacterized protein n=1 Tax=Vagococcus fluvialis bH819 TaxID=1255619 RepID=A0A1X6WLL4_9ENTE|nr:MULTISPECIES: hypothetical protein [Vagococcus]SLM85149.1 hypothetical protein FM121_03560 [Vagococcus fluvialis bH819]HCM88438.1 hypothetical protein [Vagococcus sp.]